MVVRAGTCALEDVYLIGTHKDARDIAQTV
jgi:hypothetical protein